MISKPKPLQKLTIDKSSQAKNQEDDAANEEVIKDIDSYFIPIDVSNFKDIPLGQFTVFDLTGHLITCFEGINRFPSLQKLILKKTLISSFKGSTEMPNLQEIDFSETPLSRRFYCREMALFALGFQIRVINNVPVSQIELNLSSLNTRTGIENYVQKGNFIISYPNSNPVSTFTTSNLGFCSPRCANEISTTFTEFNENYEQMKLKEPNKIASADQMYSKISHDATAFRRARTQFSNQFKWFSNLNILYSSQNEEIENLRLQIQGLKPSPSYMRQINNLSTSQKQDEEYISYLEDENEKNKKIFLECQKSLRLATEMNFNLQLKIKDAKLEKFSPLDTEIENIQKEINTIKDKQNSLISANANLKDELEVYESNDGKLQNDLNGVLQAAESLKKEKEASERDLSALLINEQQQQIKIDQYSNSLNNQNEEIENLRNQLRELNNEIDEIKQKKSEIEQRIVNSKKDFDEKISKIAIE